MSSDELKVFGVLMLNVLTSGAQIENVRTTTNDPQHLAHSITERLIH